MCHTPLLPKQRIERFVVDRLRDSALTEEHLTELIRLTNDELMQSRDEQSERLDLLEAQIADVGRRLGKLYDALESGGFASADLAPGIKSLAARREELVLTRSEAELSLREVPLKALRAEVVRGHMENLHQLF